jgi:hypothetical protein
LKEEAHRDEGPTHFFDADVFSPNPNAGVVRAADLPSHDEYADAFPALRATLLRNWTKVFRDQKMPELTLGYLARFGTAPWRAAEMYDRSVEALAKGDAETALIYLSAMGHYIADMAVPLHTTVRHDTGGNTGHGLHLAFEMKMIEALVAEKGQYKDEKTQLWGDFSATWKPVASWAERGDLSPVGRGELVQEILTLVEQGSHYVGPMNKAYAKVMAGRWFFHGEAHTLARLREAPLEFPNDVKMSVMEAANERMGSASRLLARAWLGVEREARLKNPAMKPPVAHVRFDEARTIRAYRYPRYLIPRNPAPAPEKETNDSFYVTCKRTLGRLAAGVGL